MQVMDPLRKTEREGRWLLRSGYVSEEPEIYVAVTSKRAPEGTLAKNLEPESLEITDMTGEDETVTLPVTVVKGLLDWPPNE